MVTPQLPSLPDAAAKGRLGWLVTVCAFAYFLDLSDLAIGNAFSAIFYEGEGAFDSGGLPMLLAAVFAGAFIGMPFFGAFARRAGSRNALILAAGVLSATSLLQAVSGSIATLTVFRFLAGAAIGAVPALVFAYLANQVPAARRGRIGLIVSVVALSGVPLTFFGMRWMTELELLGVDGWRWVLGLHGLASALSAVLFLILGSDAPRLGAMAARSALAVFRDPAARKKLVSLVSLAVLTPWPTIGFTLVGGAVLSAKGFDVSSSLLYLAISFTGPVACNFLVSTIADRFHRRTLMIAAVLCMVLLGPIFASLDTLTGLTIAGTAFSMAAAVFIPVFLLHAAELFSPTDRPLTTSLAWAVNRGVSAVVPLVLVPLLVSVGVGAMFALVVATLLGMLALLWLMPPSPAR